MSEAGGSSIHNQSDDENYPFGFADMNLVQ